MNISGPTEVKLPKQYAHLEARSSPSDRSLQGGAVRVKACAPPPGSSQLRPPAAAPAAAPTASNNRFVSYHQNQGQADDNLTKLSFAPLPGESQPGQEASEKWKEKRRVEREKQMIAEEKARKEKEKQEAAAAEAAEAKRNSAPPPPARPAQPTPAKPAVVTATALFDFDAQQSGDLQFKKGDVITITNQRVNGSDQWFAGTIGRRQGVFPSNYVKISGDGGGASSATQSQKAAEKAAKEQKKKEEKAAKERAAAQKKREEAERKEAQRRAKEEEKARKAEEKAAEKRRKEAEKQAKQAQKSQGQKEDTAKAIFDFDAQQAGDLPFKKGDTIVISSRSHKGSAEWWSGSCKGRTGVFPSSYVKAGAPPKVVKAPPPPARKEAPAKASYTPSPVNASSQPSYVKPTPKPSYVKPSVAAKPTSTPAPYLRQTSNATVRGPTTGFVPTVSSSTAAPGKFGGRSAPVKKWKPPAASAKSTPTPAPYQAKRGQGATTRAPTQGFVPTVAFNARTENFKAKVKPAAPTHTSTGGGPPRKGKLAIPAAFR